MSQLPKRVRALAAVSAIGAGLLVLPPVAWADGTADPGAGGTSQGEAQAGAEVATPSSGGAGGSDGSAGATASDAPVSVISASGDAIVRAGQMLESLRNTAAQAVAPAPPKTIQGRSAAPVAASAPTPAIEGESATPQLAAAPAAPASAAAPTDPLSEFVAQFTATNSSTRKCKCGWVEEDDESNPPPDNPPPDNPPADQYGWGIPIVAPPVPGAGKKYTYVACGAAVTLPPVSTVPTATTVVVSLPPALPGGGGGAMPLAPFLGGGVPGGSPAGLTLTKASYTGGLTFLTGAGPDGRGDDDSLLTGMLLSSLILAAAGGFSFWRRRVERSVGNQGKHRVAGAAGRDAVGSVR